MDWLHRHFQDLFENHPFYEPPMTDDKTSIAREHHLYGPITTRLSWIFPPSEGFLVKPQCLVMPEAADLTSHQNETDTSNASITVEIGDVSTDSMMGRVVSQWHDIYLRRNRQEVDLVVTRVGNAGTTQQDRFQTVVLVVEIKREGQTTAQARNQLKSYMTRLAQRATVIRHGQVLRGLLVTGKSCSRYALDAVDGEPRLLDPRRTQETDGKEVNEWLDKFAKECMRLW
jgi:hypothetical protein